MTPDFSYYLCSYAWYLADASRHEAAAQMCDAIRYHSDCAPCATQTLKRMYDEAMPMGYEGSQCRTNGSTKATPEDYLWGPNMSMMADTIWRYTHRFWEVDHRYFLTATSDSTRMVTGSWCESDSLLFLNPASDIADRMRFRKVAYICSPATLHELLRSDHFCNLLQKTASVVSLTGMDPDHYDLGRLSQTGVPMTNQMRSWREGATFGTCPYGTRHFMENLFHAEESGGIVDLLNICAERPIDGKNPDAIWPLENEFHQCQCGAWYRRMNFQPHVSNGIVDARGNVADVSQVAYALEDLIRENDWVQIIQQRTGRDFTLHVPVTPPPYRVDSARIFCFLVYGADVRVQVETTPFLLGQHAKKPLFWSLAKAEELRGVRKYGAINLTP